MGDIETPAQRIRQRMHRAHPGVAEGHAGHQARGGHVVAGLQVGWVGVGLGQRLGDQLDCANGQRVGDRRGIQRQVRLDGMHQRIHATGGGHAARAGEGHLRADQRHVRQQVVADDAFFQLRDLVGKNRHVGHFRTGAGRGRNGNQRRALTRHLVDTEQIRQRAVVTGIGGHALGDVDGTAAAHADQAVMPALAVHAHAVFDDGDFRVGQYAVEDFVGALTQVLERQRHGAGLDQGCVGDDQRVVHIQAREFSSQLFDGACAGEQFVGDLE